MTAAPAGEPQDDGQREFRDILTEAVEAAHVCDHPDCLAPPAVMLEAQWSDVDWEDVEACISHLPDMATHLMHHEHEGRTPWLLAVQLHPKPTL